MRARAISLIFFALMLTRAASGQNVAEVAQMKHEGGVNGIAFSPDGRYLAAQGGDCSVRVWEVPRGIEVARFAPHIPGKKGVAALPYGLAFSPDGRFLATGNLDATVRVWELASGRVVARMATTDGRLPDGVNVLPARFVLSADGRYLAAKGHDGVPRVWEAATGREVLRMNHEGSAGSVLFSPDGQYLATAVSPAIALVWEVSTGKEVARMKHEKSVWEIAWSRDGRYLLTASTEGIVHVWEWATGQEVRRMKHEYTALEMAISPDGRYLATHVHGSAHVWELTSGREIARMSHKLSRRGWIHPMRVVFSPDGRYVAGSGYSKTVLVWEATTGHEVARLNHKQDVMANIAFSPRGEYLATAGWPKGKGIVSLWSLPPSEGISANLVLPASPPKVTADSQPPRNAVHPAPPAGQGRVFDEFEMSGSREAILSAKTVKVVGVLGAVVPERWDDQSVANPAYAKNQVEEVIQKWGRYKLVEDTSEADLVLVIIEGINERIYRQGPFGERMEVHGRGPVEGEEVVRTLVDRLRVFKGGEFSKASTTPLWDSGEIEHVGFRDTFRARTPGTSAAASFRKFVEALEKETTK